MVSRPAAQFLLGEMEAKAAAAAPFLKLFGTRGIAVFETSVCFHERWALRAVRQKPGYQQRETVYSSSLGVELQLGENMFVEVGSPVWLEFAEKVKGYWCREKRGRAAESLNDEQPPRIILPRSKRPALPPPAVIAVAAPGGRLGNGGHSTVPLFRNRSGDGRVIANAMIQLQRKKRAQHQVEQLALLELSDDMRAVVLQRRVQDWKDGVTFGDSMKWARRQIERMQKVEDQRAVNQKYYDLLEAAVRKHRMIELIRVGPMI